MAFPEHGETLGMNSTIDKRRISAVKKTLDGTKAPMVKALKMTEGV